MAKKLLVNLDLSKNELQNAVTHKLASAPSSPVEGQRYQNTTDHVEYYWNGTAWIPTDATKATGIPNTALATNPLARANHTGSQLSSTISDLDTTVKAYRLDEFADPTSAIPMNGQKFTGLGAPTAGSNDAARIIDVENAVQGAAAGIDSKASVRLVATTNIASLTGLSPIDGVTPVGGDRLLLTAQTTASANGVYIAAAGAWSRAPDADTSPEVTPGAFWFVEEGTTYNKTQWRCNNSGVIVLGTTSLTIVQFGAAQTFVGGNGLVLTGNTFDVGAGTGISVGADSVAIDPAVVVRKYAALIGDGSSTSITVTHNLNNQDAMTQVREVATNNIVEVEIQNNGVNTVVISFASAPASNAYRAVVQG